MIVTKIERQKRHRNRVNLFLDGEFAFGLHEEILYKARIRIGDSLDPPTIDLIRKHEEAKLARESALRLIGHRMRSEKELRISLLEREFDPKVVDNVLHDLQTSGMIDDRKFASAFIRDARLRKPTGSSILFRKLRLKGVDRGLIEDALGENLSSVEEAEMAYAAAVKLLTRFRTSRKPLPPEKLQRRVEQYLAQRGFPWNAIKPAVKKAFGSSDTQ